MNRIASIGALKQFLKTEFKVTDVFYSAWADLTPKQQVEVYTLWLKMKSMDGQLSIAYSTHMLLIMRQLRKNQRVIDQMNEAQVVDCFNEIKGFLDEPWYNFPPLNLPQGGDKPADKMATSTFDHFIYADNEFSLFLIKKDDIHLKRLVATLYQENFNKEAVEGIASRLKLSEWQLLHVFYTFKHVREFVMKRCKNLMPPPPVHPETGEIIKDETGPVATGAMWLKLKHRLAETPAFAGYDKAGQANMYSALDYLEDLAIQANERRVTRG